MASALLWGGIAQGVLGALGGTLAGITGAQARQRQSGALRQEADAIDSQIREIDEFVSRNQMDPNEAVKRIANIMESASAEVRASINTGLQAAVSQMRDAYGWSVQDLNQQLAEMNDIFEKNTDKFKKEWRNSYNTMKDTMVTRGLGGSEALAAMQAKSASNLQEGVEGLTAEQRKGQEAIARQKTRMAEQLASGIKTAELSAASQLAAQMANLGMQRGQMEESARNRADAYNLSLGQWGIGNRLQGRQQQSLLRRQASSIGAQPGPGMSGLLGGLGGLSGSDAVRNIALGLQPSGSSGSTFDLMGRAT